MAVSLRPNASSSDLEHKISADNGTELPPPETVAGEAEHKTGAWSEMWNATYRGRTIMLVIYNLFQTIGYYGFSSWVPTLLISQGIDVTKSLAYTFIIAMRQPDRPADRRIFSPIISSANGRSPGRQSASPYSASCCSHCNRAQSASSSSVC